MRLSMSLHPLLAVIAAVAVTGLARPSAALPPTLVWVAPSVAPDAAPPARLTATLVVELDASGARLQSAVVAGGRVKIKRRAPSGTGLFYVVRDAAGEPLWIGESFDARRELFGDELDPATGALRSLTVLRDEVTFPLRVPLIAGAVDVALFERAAPRQPVTPDEIVAAVRAGDASLVPRGVLALPGPADRTSP